MRGDGKGARRRGGKTQGLENANRAKDQHLVNLNERYTDRAQGDGKFSSRPPQ